MTEIQCNEETGAMSMA